MKRKRSGKKEEKKRQITASTLGGLGCIGSPLTSRSCISNSILTLSVCSLYIVEDMPPWARQAGDPSLHLLFLITDHFWCLYLQNRSIPVFIPKIPACSQINRSTLYTLVRNSTSPAHGPMRPPVCRLLRRFVHQKSDLGYHLHHENRRVLTTLSHRAACIPVLPGQASET